MSAQPPQIVISYAKEDANWLQELEKTLKPLQRQGHYLHWVDKGIETGALWLQEIENALNSARMAILLVSRHFLASDFIMKEELPLLMKRAEQGQLLVFWIPVSDASWEKEPFYKYQAAWPTENPLDKLSPSDLATALRKIREDFEKALDRVPVTDIPNTSGPFRVLLLATDGDLGATRQKLAKHLRDVQGMLVDENSAYADQQAVVLLQGYRWEGGALAQTWQQVPASQRLLFLSNDESGWPPMVHFEKAAMADIESFRAHQPTALFDHPDQLQEPVVDALIELRQASSSAPAVGATPAERAYLRHWQKFWSRGRTRGKQSETDEIYQQELYVPLSGTSPQFEQDEQGRIQHRKRSEDLKVTHDEAALLRLPLARWAAAHHLRLLVLSGSPGAGKTVFLTRFAAALAKLLLGMEPEREEGVTWDQGPPPIPVVLDATTLAVERLTVPRLATLLRSELTQVQTEDLPDVGELERQLGEGRYLLLIDALDEVAEKKSRNDLVAALNDLVEALPTTRLLLTTRPPRYTDDLALAPNFATIEVDRLDQDQVDQLCAKFVARNPDTELDKGALRQAVTELDAHLKARGEEPFSTNALMLTCVCTVYKRYHTLPDERVPLLDKLVEELCQARQAALNPKQKRELLERLALAMQEGGRQQLSQVQAECLLAQAQSGSCGQKDLQGQVTMLLETGLLYEEAGAAGSCLRFAHRLFREYLCACRLVGDGSMEELVAQRETQLADPTWLDVFGLLPGVRYRQDLAAAYGEALQQRADSGKEGRLWGLLAAGMVENRSLYPDAARKQVAKAIAARYEAQGAEWPLETRLFVLEQLGRLGDPRLDLLQEQSWVRLPAGRYPMGSEEGDENERPPHHIHLSADCWLGRFPVTNAEYGKFMAAGGYEQEHLWDPEGWTWLNLDEQGFNAWFVAQCKQVPGTKEKWVDYFRPERRPKYWNEADFNRTNQPVVGVNWYEAKAYCRWLTEQLEKREWGKGRAEVRLLREAEWEAGARGAEGRRFPWGHEQPDRERANFDSQLGRTSPVGGYPRGQAGQLADLMGNVWEWCLDIWDEKAYARREGAVDPEVGGSGSLRVVRGGAWHYPAQDLTGSYRVWNWAGLRVGNGGFRCCLQESSS